ncbi:hypothetical protein [Lentzea sp. NPDC003310]|uniref:hypothetical protein n=1 Tax=Lentzea sp. NPDC003310 TaxID=3154447 RepID=UPI0033A11ECB
MPLRYRYYALLGLRDTLADPFAVVRVGGQFAESFKTDLRWSRTDLMDRIRTGRDDFEVVEIGEEDANRFEASQARRTADARERDAHRAGGRALGTGDHSKMAPRYRYYALVGVPDTLENPHAVVRVDGRTEETFTTSLEWARTDVMNRIRWGRDDYEVVEIGEEDAERFETTQARRVQAVRERDGE